MSGSPKYCQAQLERERQQQLEQERLRQAEIEARKRREREAEELQRRVREAHADVQRVRSNHEATLEATRAASFARFASGEIAALEVRLAALAGEAGRARDLSSILRIRGEFDELGREAAIVEGRARAAERAERLRKEMEARRAEAEAKLADLQARFDAGDSARGRKFDEAGARRVADLLVNARDHLNQQRYDEAQAALSSAGAALAGHVQAVARAYGAWEAARHGARTQYADLYARAAGLRADDVVLTWCRVEVEAVERDLAAADALVAAERWDDARALLSRTGTAIAALLDKAQVRQLAEEKRSFIVNGLVSVLAAQGFQVGEPDLLRTGDLDSDVVLRAIRPDRRTIAVAVPVGGRVTYEVDGYAKRVESGPDGAPTATCDEAESRLETIHEQLAAEFGIEMGELEWEGKHPLRRRKGEKDLPTGGGHAGRTQNR